MTIQVLLVDDQPLLRVGFRMILSAEPDMVVSGEAADGADAVRLTAELNPDVVLMDVRMPGMNGVEATRQIVAGGHRAQILILTTFDLDEYAFAGLRAGASGFLLKDVLPDDLIAAIRAVASGDAVVSPRITRKLLDRYAGQLSDDDGQPVAGAGHPPGLDRLTDRERQVLLEVAAGLSNAEIASKFVLSEATVKTHVTRVLAKLGLRDRVQAVVLAYQSGLVRP
ncbi:MAG TPA: response regulator transcription factor [Mycobacteriales bacterium]|jgi:DNA-binding NarL/FixJ family response regulator|nr:response regulator transcription factor [Mycobacteriales bacterium]